MSRIRCEVDLHFWLHNREYVITERLLHGYLKIKDVVSENISEITEKELSPNF